MTLEIKICNEIVNSFLDEKKKDISFFKRLFSGSYYKGKHSTYFIRDWLAGGSANNFGYDYFPRSEYANFILFVQNICLKAPNAKEILQELKNAQNLDDIFNIIEKNKDKDYISSKCYYDLIKDLGKLDSLELLPSVKNHNAIKRKAATESHRISKILCFGYEICQGINEAYGIMMFPFIATLTSIAWWPAIMTVFVIAAYLNYSIGREETTKFILRYKMGNHLRREVIKDGEISYEEFSDGEKRLVRLFEFLSMFAALCSVGLTATSMLGFLSLGAYILPIAMIIPTCLIFTNMVYKVIDHHGMQGVKDYLYERFKMESIKDLPRVIYEGFKLVFSIVVSGFVAYATFGMFNGKLLHFAAKLGAAAPYIAGIASGITAGVKALFSVSKITQLLESIGRYLFQKKTDKKEEFTGTEFDGLRKQERLLSTLSSAEVLARFGHSFSEVGLAWQGFSSRVGADSSQSIPPLERTALYSKGAYSFCSVRKENASEEYVSKGPGIRV